MYVKYDIVSCTEEKLRRVCSLRHYIDAVMLSFTECEIRTVFFKSCKCGIARLNRLI